MTSTDTIVARATPPGRGGIGIVRVSGSRAPEIAQALLGSLPAPRHATLGAFRDARGEVIDAGLALYFPAPNSYTGEAVLELHGHGGPVVTDMLIRQRRIFDVAKRREVIHELQRYLARQQYYIQMPSGVYVAVWDGALKNYGPNLGYDYGGRLVAAWLDR